MRTVYPCVYREHYLLNILLFAPYGLSLCVQGTYSSNWQGLCNTRFIPVCTGNIRFSEIHGLVVAVYPCVYREHPTMEQEMYTLPGLSLCVQGTCIAATTLKNLHRFIPVCTGNILTANEVAAVFSVYPCVYREHNCPRNTKCDNCGLSLCVQGTLYVLLSITKPQRFIPVCTGNMLIVIVNSFLFSVYPCVYREHVFLCAQFERILGLSLCVQGTFS